MSCAQSIAYAASITPDAALGERLIVAPYSKARLPWVTATPLPVEVAKESVLELSRVPPRVSEY